MMMKSFEKDPWTARLSEYVDGELDPAEVHELEMHLATCEVCPVLLRDLSAVVQTLHQSATTPPPLIDADRIWPRILNRLATDRFLTGSEGVHERSHLIDAIVAALILAIGIATGYWLGQCGRTNGWPKPSWLHLGTASAPAIAPTCDATERV